MSRPLAQHQRPDCNEPRDQLDQGKATVELGEKPIEDIAGASALFIDTIRVLMLQCIKSVLYSVYNKVFARLTMSKIELEQTSIFFFGIIAF